MKPIILIGSRQDNLAIVRAAESKGRIIAGIVDRFYVGQNIDGFEVIASDLDLLDSSTAICKQRHEYDWFVNTIFTGVTDTDNDNANSFLLRNQRAAMARTAGLTLTNIIHANSYVDTTAVLGENIFVGWGTAIGGYCRIGNFNFIPYNCGFAHHIITGDFCTFIGNNTVIGNTKFGNNVFVGPGVTFSKTKIDPISIGNNVIVAPGVTVLKSIADNKIYLPNYRTATNHTFTI